MRDAADALLRPRELLGDLGAARQEHPLVQQVRHLRLLAVHQEQKRWCVNTEDFNESGRVYLELADATPAEAARGMALLEKVAI